MRRHRVGTSLYAGVLFVVLGVLAWATGQPFIFPSLGPSAFILAFERESNRTQLTSVVVSHLIGGVAGLLAYTLLASGVSLVADPAAFSTAGLRLVASATLSIVATSWGMIATDTIHAPACATTLIVSLGLLSTPLQVTTIVLGVGVLVAFHALVLSVYHRAIGSSRPGVVDG
ncbi:HPP family protein [Haloarcula sp. CBA1130]|uniref:HPP family protein n=1 Tax=unclassified Haloarcula TaxID=2624677 RepID=UPI0012479106|nr:MULTISPECIES: HPP family protein [unclassified Haloarcula]KAA9399621.1 HPP family protein [Haloarcula sp. CBA1129]KAA9401345.1 HPP family protein [Haloarcula sp. CBA1130]